MSSSNVMIVKQVLRSRATIMEFVVQLLRCGVNVGRGSLDPIVSFQHHVASFDVSNE
jgi:hypothetical protein